MLAWMTETQLKAVQEAAEGIILKAQLRSLTEIAEESQLSIGNLRYHAHKRALEIYGAYNRALEIATSKEEEKQK
jgi:hypothetical protein